MDYLFITYFDFTVIVQSYWEILPLRMPSVTYRKHRIAVNIKLIEEYLIKCKLEFCSEAAQKEVNFNTAALPCVRICNNKPKLKQKRGKGLK